MNKPLFIRRFQNGNYHRKPRFWAAIVIVLIIAVLLRHCSMTFFGKNYVEGQPVVSAVAHSSDVPVYISALGAVTPTYTITVKTQVTGQLMRVLFKDGQMVKKGDLLAEIDTRPYEAQLTQYEGQLVRDQALLANAKRDLERYRTLWRQDSISKQTLDTQVSLVQQDEGTVKIDEGLIATTKVNLIYCKITAPVDGKIGISLVDPGNIVQPSDTTGIAIINTLNPITVIFSIAEDDIPEVIDEMATHQSLLVDAYDRQQEKLLATGTLLAIDNQVDPTTGMIKLKANFQNDNNRLFPNQFVNVRLRVKTLPHTTLVPTAAIQYSTKGSFVYVINDDHTVSMKPVVASVTSGENTAISSGVSPGQTVVIEGADKLTDGVPVKVADISPSSPNTNGLKSTTSFFGKRGLQAIFLHKRLFT